MFNKPNLTPEEWGIVLKDAGFVVLNSFMFGAIAAFFVPGIVHVAWGIPGGLVFAIGVILMRNMPMMALRRHRELKAARLAANERQQAEQLRKEAKQERKYVKWLLRKCDDIDIVKLRSRVLIKGYDYGFGEPMPPQGSLVIDPKVITAEEVGLISRFVEANYDLTDALILATVRLPADDSVLQAGERQLDQAIDQVVNELMSAAYNAAPSARQDVENALKEMAVG